MVLRGIAFGARPGVVIEEGGKQQVYLQGERLGSHNAVIEEINRDHVMLRYRENGTSESGRGERPLWR